MEFPRPDLRGMRARAHDGYCSLFGIDDLIIAGISAGTGLLKANSNKNAINDTSRLVIGAHADNATIIGNTLDNNTKLAADNQAANTQIWTDARDRNDALLTQSQIDAFNLARSLRDTNRGYIDDARTANQTETIAAAKHIQDYLDANKADNTRLLTENRDQVNQALGANKSENAALLSSNRDANLARLTGAEAANEADIRASGARAEDVYRQTQGANQGLFQPFVQSGTAANSAISALLGLSGDASAQRAAFDTWRNATGYQFALQQGQNNVIADYSQMGGLESGAAQKALATFNQNLANKTFDSYMGGLARQAESGLSAADRLANSNITTGAGLAGVMVGTGDRLTNNRNFTTSGVVDANNYYTSGSTANNNNYLAGLTDNLNRFLDGSIGVNNFYTSGSADNALSYRDAMMSGANAWRDASTANNTHFIDSVNDDIDLYSDRRASNTLLAAQGLVGVNNTAATAGATANTSARDAWTSNNDGMVKPLTNTNADKAANNNQLYSTLGGVAQSLPGILDKIFAPAKT